MKLFRNHSIACCALLFFVLLLGQGCVGARDVGRASGDNPVSWPGKVLIAGGEGVETAPVSGLPSLGRAVQGFGRLLEAPAVLLELRPGDAGDSLIRGTGQVLAEVPNTILSPLTVTDTRIDLSGSVDAINRALRHLDAQAPGSVLPVGTTVQPSGKGLLWTLPGKDPVTQYAEISWWFDLFDEGGKYTAQERAWGFVTTSRHVNTEGRYDILGNPRKTAITILHEFYHQYHQITGTGNGGATRGYRGMIPLYWIGYGPGLLWSEGYLTHWAESAAQGGALRVERELQEWTP